MTRREQYREEKRAQKEVSLEQYADLYGSAWLESITN
jgi:hypothetical protein